jgi:hypothetical protein
MAQRWVGVLIKTYPILSSSKSTQLDRLWAVSALSVELGLPAVVPP